MRGVYPAMAPKHIAAAVAVLALVAIVAHARWMKAHCVCGPKPPAKFHGWRHQHYEDAPYNGQAYRCGGREGFNGDEAGWPGAGTFGALADTYPYGNYAGGIDMYYPTFAEGLLVDQYWSKT